MHIGHNDVVKMCPGANSRIQTYEPGKLREIWEKNQVRREFQGRTSHRCPPRDVYYPIKFRGAIKV